MNKTSLFLALSTACLVATSSYAQSSAFEGYYVGARGGVLQSFANASTSSTATFFNTFGPGTTQTLATASGNTSLGRNFAEGDLFVGYGKKIDCTPFFLSGEIFLNEATRQNTVKSQALNSNSGFGTDDVDALLTSSTRAKLHSFEYGLDFKPGILLNPQTILYGRVGVSFNELDVSSSSSLLINDFESDVIASSPASFSSSQHVTGWRFGLGLEEYLCKCVSVTADYIYTTYGSGHGVSGTADVSNTAISDAITGMSMSGSGKISTQAFLVGIKYSFA